RFAPERVLYLVNTLGRKRVYRDAAFLTLVGGGGKHLPIGLPLGKDRFHPRPGEREAARLLRCLDSLGTADLSHPSNWDLGISAAETAQAEARLRSGPPGLLDQPLLMAGAGAKVPAKDWGAERWGAFLRQAREMLPNGPGPMGLLLCGGPDERPRFEALAQHWPSRSEGGGPVDIITDPPRITAALCAHPLVKAFVGHDGGPMHLAAAAGCPTIGLFAGTDHYGRWTPLGPPGKQRTMEHPVPCAPCFSLTCKTPGHPCLAEITPTQLWQNLLDILNQDRVET
ncbi:MAG: glycosyltransferase family 9 protein, partial [Rhodospirillaceae bacterium]